LVDSTRRSYILGAVLPWLQRYEALNPQAALRPFSSNITLMLAEKSPVVPVRTNAEAFQQLTGRMPIVIKRANHYFQECATCTSAEAAALPNTVSEDVLRALVDALAAVRPIDRR
jgi:hypothetical protein